MPKIKQLETPETVNAKKLGEIMGIGERRVQILEKEKVFKKHGHGKYILAGAGKSYAEYIAKSEVGRREGGSVRQDVEFERARKLRLENDQLENFLIGTQLAISAIDKIMGVLQSELAGLPAQASDDVSVRRKVENGVERILESITGRFEQAGEALAAGRDPFEAGEEDDM